MSDSAHERFCFKIRLLPELDANSNEYGYSDVETDTILGNKRMRSITFVLLAAVLSSSAGSVRADDLENKDLVGKWYMKKMDGKKEDKQGMKIIFGKDGKYTKTVNDSAFESGTYQVKGKNGSFSFSTQYVGGNLSQPSSSNGVTVWI